jgi:hypothetical protein
LLNGQDSDNIRDLQLPFVLAWDILLQAKILHAGMALDEAISILGEPTYRDNDIVGWSVPSRSRGVIALNANVREGKVTGWKSR